MFSFFVVNETSALAEGYKLKDERCADGTLQQRCRPSQESECDPSAQTSCRIILT